MSKFILFHSRHKNINYTNFSIKINGIKLNPTEHVKYLGVYMDKHLSWDFHINQLCNKSSQANVPKKTMVSVYYALFYSHMTYGSLVWSLTTQNNLDSIFRLQKKCIRIIAAFIQ